MGNQYAKGNSGGISPYDLDKEAKDLLEWSLRDDALRLYGFCDPKPYPFQTLSEFAERSPVFREALIKAKNRLAIRREEHCNKDQLKDVIYNKTAHIYDVEYDDTDERKKDRELARQLKKIEAEAKLKNEEKDKLPPLDSVVEKDNKIMLLESKLEKMQEIIDNLTKAK